MFSLRFSFCPESRPGSYAAFIFIAPLSTQVYDSFSIFPYLWWLWLFSTQCFHGLSLNVDFWHLLMIRLTSCIFGKNITEMTLCPSQSIISSYQEVHDIKMSYNWSCKPSSFRYHSVCQTASLKSSLLWQLINILWGDILRLWKYLVSHHIFYP